MTLEDLRRQYTLGGLNENEMPEQPMELFAEWMKCALDNAPAEWVEPYAMTLATSTLTGEVSARIVLLRGFDDSGFVFYTSYESLKSSQIDLNSNCALVFHWGYLERQVRITGSVSRVSRKQSEAYFHKRPRGSQIGATVSRQSHPVASRNELETAASAFEKEIGDAMIPLPASWGGYCVFPEGIEFWQGRRNRLHDRIVYSRLDSSGNPSHEGAVAGWTMQRLSP